MYTTVYAWVGKGASVKHVGQGRQGRAEGGGFIVDVISWGFTHGAMRCTLPDRACVRCVLLRSLRLDHSLRSAR